MAGTALLLVDIQNDYFADGAFALPEMESAASNAAKLLAAIRSKGGKIIHIRHEENDPSSGFLLAGTDGCKINSIVEPRSGETIVTKNFPNAFRDSSLLSALGGISDVVIAGAMSNMCIDATARAAFDHGYSVTVVEDACAACDLEFNGKTIQAQTVHGSFMAALAAAYGTVLTTDQFLNQK